MTRPAAQLLYRYGPVAYVWRVLGLAAVVAGSLLVYLAVRDGKFGAITIGLPLIAPVVVLFPMVAVRMTLVDRGAAERAPGAKAARSDMLVEVVTLAGFTRRIELERFGGHRYHATAQGEVSRVHAPRVWVRVRGAWPVHVDLMGTIPDRRLLASTLGLPIAIV